MRQDSDIHSLSRSREFDIFLFFLPLIMSSLSLSLSLESVKEKWFMTGRETDNYYEYVTLSSLSNVNDYVCYADVNECESKNERKKESWLCKRTSDTTRNLWNFRIITIPDNGSGQTKMGHRKRMRWQSFHFIILLVTAEHFWVYLSKPFALSHLSHKRDFSAEIEGCPVKNIYLSNDGQVIYFGLTSHKGFKKSPLF